MVCGCCACVCSEWGKGQAYPESLIEHHVCGAGVQGGGCVQCVSGLLVVSQLALQCVITCSVPVQCLSSEASASAVQLVLMW